MAMNTPPSTAALQQEIEELLQFMYLMPVAVARFGAAGEVEMLNPQAVQLLQDLDVDSGSADGAAILDALCPGLAADWHASAGSTGAVGDSGKGRRSSLHRHDGRPLHLLLRLVRPDTRCTMLVVEDISTTVEQERELGRQRRRMALALEHIQGYGVAMLDAGGHVNDWNPSLGRLLGRPEDSALGQSLLDWLAPDAVEPGETPAAPHSFEAICQAVAGQGWCHLQAPWRHADGRVLWGDCVVTPLIESDGGTSGFVAVIRDVTDEHQRHQQLLGEALTDPLTGLFNRRGLARRATATAAETAKPAAQRAGQPGAEGPAWLMLDIDHFKLVNDTHGHDGGDTVLKALAAAMQAVAREGDTLARLGGEEFVLRLPAANEMIARRVAERLRLSVQALAIPVGRHAVRITASFGVALQGAEEDWAQALERADAALYEAKHSGRNCVVLAAPAGRIATAA